MATANCIPVIAAERWVVDLMTFAASILGWSDLSVYIVGVTAQTTARIHPWSQEILLASEINQHSCYSGYFMLLSDFIFF